MYAGNAMATVQVSDGGVVAMTVQPTTFEKAAETGGSANVSALAAPGDAGKATWLSDEVAKSDRPELSAASAVVAGGRGMKNGENFGECPPTLRRQRALPWICFSPPWICFSPDPPFRRNTTKVTPF